MKKTNTIKLNHPEDNTMIDLLTKRNKIQDDLNLTIKDIKYKWKKHYKNNRPFYDDVTIYTWKGSDKARLKNKVNCLDVYDHIIYYALLGKDPMKMFAKTTIDNKKYLDLFKNVNRAFSLNKHIEKVYGKPIKDNKVFISKLSQYIDEYIEYYL